jgi:hypothetical protein
MADVTSERILPRYILSDRLSQLPKAMMIVSNFLERSTCQIIRLQKKDPRSRNLPFLTFALPRLSTTYIQYLVSMCPSE